MINNIHQLQAHIDEQKRQLELEREDFDKEKEQLYSEKAQFYNEIEKEKKKLNIWKEEETLQITTMKERLEHEIDSFSAGEARVKRELRQLQIDYDKLFVFL